MISQNKINIAILASGNGSNAVNIIELVKTEFLNLRIKTVITDKLDAPVINKACRLEVETHVFEFEYLEGEDKKEIKKKHESKLLDYLKNLNVQIVLLAGYMKILSEDFLNNFASKETGLIEIYNIHPSLLPKYKGLNAYEKAFESSDNEYGVTIHRVDSGTDTGKILLQKKFIKLSDMSLNEFKEEGLKTEHLLYKDFLEILNNGNNLPT